MTAKCKTTALPQMPTKYKLTLLRRDRKVLSIEEARVAIVLF